MAEKIIFWLNAYMLFFGLAAKLQKKYDCELYAMIDITNRTKEFFKSQDIVNFKETWFLHDNIKKSNELDLEYLENFEKKYGINLWQLGFNERIFYLYNDLYKFSQHEILSILEQECKLYESVLDKINPDILVTGETALHQQHLFYKICQARGIKILILNQSKIAYKCIISKELNKLDFMPNLLDIKSKKRNFQELRNCLTSSDNAAQLKTYEKNFGGTKTTKLNAAFEFFFKSDNSNVKTHFTYYGRKKSKVLLNHFLLSIKSKQRKSFIDGNLEQQTDFDEKYVLFTLHQEPERTLLIESPYYTNQLEVIRHIAKSLPIGFKLYVKEHFSQSLREWREISFYKQILEIPNVRLFHPNVNTKKLIEKSSLIISIAGTISFEAAFYQKPSIVMSDMAFTILPSIQKLDSIQDLPLLIKKGLTMNVNADDLDRFLTILEEQSFDFDLKGYEISEANLLRYGGSFHDTIITNQQMNNFLEHNEKLFDILAEQYIKKLSN